MLNRRLLILFFAFLLGFGVLAARLAKLQLVDGAHWQEEMQAFVHRTHVIETYRGALVDRNGQILARDVPSDELAIDYRAMNLDDAWLGRSAIEELKVAGEWGHFPDRAARNRRLEEVKGELAEKIAGIPKSIAAVVAEVEHVPAGVVEEEVLQRFQDIRARIQVLRQGFWSRRFEAKAAGDSSTGDSNADVDDATLDSQYRQTQLKDEVVAHTIRSNIPSTVANYFRQHAVEYPGLVVRDNANRREYPFGEATAQIVGTLRSVDQGTLVARKFMLPNLLEENLPGDLAGYLPGDRMGESGVEKSVEEKVRGVRGARLVDLAENGDETGGGGEDSKHVDPQPGKDVRLTIDAGLQRDLYAAFTDPSRHFLHGEVDGHDDGKDHFIAVVVLSMDGQLMAAVSCPSYDPNTIDDNRGTLNGDAWRTPLVNRAISAVYQPGSTIKPILATAGLTEHVITAEETITCLGHLYPNRPDVYRCDKLDGHGPLSLVPAIAESCDVYFYTVGMRMGLGRLARWYDLYGFGRDTGLELPEADGTIPNPAAHPDPEDATRESIFLGIGQGKIVVTPIQMANAYATMLRQGVAIEPRIFAETPMKETQAFHISNEVLGTVKRGMEAVVSTGTAKGTFKGFHLPVAGKTGTAETRRAAFDDAGHAVPDTSKPVLGTDGKAKVGPDGQPQYRQLIAAGTDGWFVGYAPADRPQFIVAAVKEFGGHGGSVAAPLVQEAFRQLEAHNYLPHMDVP